MSCTTTDLGSFAYCDGVDIDFVDSQVTVEGVERKWECTFNDGNFGRLNPGWYVFIFDSENYQFEVI